MVNLEIEPHGRPTYKSRASPACELVKGEKTSLGVEKLQLSKKGVVASQTWDRSNRGQGTPERG